MALMELMVKTVSARWYLYGTDAEWIESLNGTDGQDGNGDQGADDGTQVTRVTRVTTGWQRWSRCIGSCRSYIQL